MAVARATKLATSTVRKGRDEAQAGAKPSDVVRTPVARASIVKGKLADQAERRSLGTVRIVAQVEPSLLSQSSAHRAEGNASDITVCLETIGVLR
jgi:hypothetical protein